MLFNSYSFLFVFFPISLFGFFLLKKWSPHLVEVWLALCSLLFFSFSDAVHLPLLLGSITFNYFIGRGIRPRSISRIPFSSRAIFLIGLVVNLSVLSYFKYAGFLTANFAKLFGLHLSLGNIQLPVGISFFTFTQIAYLVDVYKGKAAETHPTRYALFVSYYPHLIAGPILHHAEMIPQFEQKLHKSSKIRDFSMGMSFLAGGLFKKVIIADSVAFYTKYAFETGAHPTVIQSWIGALAYTFQIYFDFSAYSDMAIGVSLFLGVNLPLNFNSPYKAKNIIDFWRRWHISLSRFLRDYLYIPLGGNRQSGTRRYANLMCTMLLGGLWHGASWNFVIWGGLHGLFLMTNHAWKAIQNKLPLSSAGKSGRGKVLSHLLTFVAVVFAWVYFRASDLSSANSVVAGMLGHNGVGFGAAKKEISTAWLALPQVKDFVSVFDPLTWIRYGVEISRNDWSYVGAMLWLGVCFPIALFLPNLQEWLGYTSEGPARSPVEQGIFTWRPSLVMGAAVGIVLGASIGMMFGFQPARFLYFNF